MTSKHMKNKILFICLILFIIPRISISQVWVESMDRYAREVFLPAEKYKWDWGQATLLRAMVNLYESKETSEKPIYLNYIRTAMDATMNVANGKHPNALASGHGMAFLARVTGEEKYRKKAFEIYADYLTTPRASNGGISHRVETIELWDDTIYMLSMYLLEMYRLTNDEKYIAEFSSQLKAHSEKLADKKWGLWIHGWDNDKVKYNDGCSTFGWPDSVTHASKEFWGRGNGWITMALADAMRIVPQKSKYWHLFKNEFEKHIKNLPELQDSLTGHWYQLPVYPGEGKNYLESSCTAMFSYGLTVALELKIIDEKRFRPVIEKACKGLSEYSLKRLDNNYVTTTNVCMGTCIGNKDYYLDRAKVEGTNFGVGAFIMFGDAYKKLR